MHKLAARIGVCVLFAAIAMWAQSFLSSITGKVIDPAGAAIPNAKVVAAEIRTGATRETVSNSSGDISWRTSCPATTR